MLLQQIDFEDILPIWKNNLWPNRTSKIKPMSSMIIRNGQIEYDMSIYQKYTATFLAVFIENLLIGVNSGHRTSDFDFRSRGLWVDHRYRGKGISRLLLRETCETAKNEGCTKVWTLPRYNSMHAYISAGFVQESDWFDDKVEFGPNCVALKYL